jgi:methionine sulfoxide reductase heme-binding subunit
LLHGSIIFQKIIKFAFISTIFDYDDFLKIGGISHVRFTQLHVSGPVFYYLYHRDSARVFLAPAPIANIFGFLALLCYVATLIPSLLKTVFPPVKSTKILIWLLKYRRYLGVTTFCLGGNHGFLLIFEKHLSLFDLYTYIHYFQGILTLAIFTLLAATSNNESVKYLKKKWKKLHQLTYVAVFSLPWHILDKMSGHWTYLTPLAILLTIITLVLFARKKYLEISKVLAVGDTKSIDISKNL